MSNTTMSDVFDLPLAADENMLYQNDNGGVIECEYDLDAEAIALAVNNYDNLVKALERIKDAPLGTLHRMYATDALQAIKGEQ